MEHTIHLGETSNTITQLICQWWNFMERTKYVIIYNKLNYRNYYHVCRKSTLRIHFLLDKLWSSVFPYQKCSWSRVKEVCDFAAEIT
jgi:hypothetical protein